MLDTLSPSPRAAVLSEGALRTPRRWLWHTFGGISFATPQTWPTRQTDLVLSCRSFVALGGRLLVSHSTLSGAIEPDRPVVDLDTDQIDDTSLCPDVGYQESGPARGNGVQVDVGSAEVATRLPHAWTSQSASMGSSLTWMPHSPLTFSICSSSFQAVQCHSTWRSGLQGTAWSPGRSCTRCERHDDDDHGAQARCDRDGAPDVDGHRLHKDRDHTRQGCRDRAGFPRPAVWFVR